MAETGHDTSTRDGTFPAHPSKAAIEAAVGSSFVSDAPSMDTRYRSDLFGNYPSNPALLVKPATTAEVAAILKIAQRDRIPVVPMGGRTGIVGGTAGSPDSLILSLERMNRIIDVAPRAMTVTIEAGAILQHVHEAAEAVGAMLPLDLGARGSATIGGNIATNAGGNRVLRWGMMRDMVIGLEAVLADGTIVSSLGSMLKDNAGYDWKHLLIGSEGTLAIVTKAILRLRPAPSSSQTALIALKTFENAITLLRRLERDLAGQLSSFELMWRNFFEAVTNARSPGQRPALAHGHALYVLVEALGNHSERDNALFEEALSAALADGLVEDAVIAGSERERANLWAIREDIGPAVAGHRPWGFDISMALADMPQVIDQSEAAIRARYPGAMTLHYGHAGDGNLHIIVAVDGGSPEDERHVENAVYGAVRDVGGSISAEHGIGIAKIDFLGWTRGPSEIALMRTLKRALDPAGILNPGKILA